MKFTEAYRQVMGPEGERIGEGWLDDFLSTERSRLDKAIKYVREVRRLAAELEETHDLIRQKHLRADISDKRRMALEYFRTLLPETVEKAPEDIVSALKRWAESRYHNNARS